MTQAIHPRAVSSSPETQPSGPSEIHRGGAVSCQSLTAAPAAAPALLRAASAAGPAVPVPDQGQQPPLAPCPSSHGQRAHPDPLSPQELIRNKARNRQNCALLEQAYAVVSALPQRAENQLHVSLMENYPGTLEALGEPIRQVWGAPCRVGHGAVVAASWADRDPLLPQGHFIVWEGAPGARMPWRGHHRHVFLFRHHLVVCKPRRDSRTDTFSYVFRNMMKVCRCWLGTCGQRGLQGDGQEEA